MRAGIERHLRRLPIRGRILSIAALNTAVILLLALLVLDGARQLKTAWSDLLAVRRADRVLSALEAQAGQLQAQIHRYFTQPNPELLAQIEASRKSLTRNLAEENVARAQLQPPIADLARITDRLMQGFDRLRAVRGDISKIYETDILQAAQDISGLFAILEGAQRGDARLMSPALAKSRDVFSRVLVATNGYYLTVSANSAQDAFSGLAMMAATLPVMQELAETEFQRSSLLALKDRIAKFRQSLLALSQAFDAQATLLRDAVDRSQTEMTDATGRLAEAIHIRETGVQDRLDHALEDVYWRIAAISIIALILIAAAGTAIARSINRPLDRLIASIDDIVQGRLHEPVEGTTARDEIGVMARAIDLFRHNAIAKRVADEELRASRDRIEIAYADLRKAQTNLVEAEKLAALGGLVAGIAHEINNPVGISITVASTLERRCEDFAADVARGELRRSKLDQFAISTREAAKQLLVNLTRAGDLVQSFKQVAVDRSQSDRRSFDLLEVTDQILASLRPSLSNKAISLELRGPPGIELDTYPGAYGQVLTNLFLNAVTHAFEPGIGGTIRVEISAHDPDHVQIDFSDTGRGMEESIRRRVFEPFFTTMRGRGGTGLGLHIAYSVVTQQLGGRMTLTTDPGFGARFTMLIPRRAPQRALEEEQLLQEG